MDFAFCGSNQEQNPSHFIAQIVRILSEQDLTILAPEA
jgi:hypothetical protein